MRQGLLTLVLAVLALSSSTVYSQDESRESNSNPNPNLAAVERPHYTDLQITDLFDKISIGLKCSEEANSIRTYLFSDEDLDLYLNKFASIKTHEAQASRTEAQGKLQVLLDHASTTLDEIGIAEKVTLTGYELNFTDSHKTFNVIQMDMDALIAGTDTALQMLIVDFGGFYRILSIRKAG